MGSQQSTKIPGTHQMQQLYEASKEGNYESVKWLLQEYTYDDDNYNEALNNACIGGHLFIVINLLSKHKYDICDIHRAIGIANDNNHESLANYLTQKREGLTTKYMNHMSSTIPNSGNNNLYIPKHSE